MEVVAPHCQKETGAGSALKRLSSLPICCVFTLLTEHTLSSVSLLTSLYSSSSHYSTHFSSRAPSGAVSHYMYYSKQYFELNIKYCILLNTTLATTLYLFLKFTSNFWVKIASTPIYYYYFPVLNKVKRHLGTIKNKQWRIVDFFFTFNVTFIEQ